MAESALKVRLKSGAREIEAEGTRQDVEAILDKWWATGTLDADGDDGVADTPTPAASLGKPKRRATPKRAAKPADAAEAFKPHELANTIREAPDYAAYEKKVLHAKGDNFRKMALVLLLAKRRMRPSQVQKTLEALGVKIGAPRISKVLTDQKGSFIASGTQGVGTEYELTGKAKADFEVWLTGDAGKS